MKCKNYFRAKRKKELLTIEDRERERGRSKTGFEFSTLSWTFVPGWKVFEASFSTASWRRINGTSRGTFWKVKIRYIVMKGWKSSLAGKERCSLPLILSFKSLKDRKWNGKKRIEMCVALWNTLPKWVLAGIFVGVGEASYIRKQLFLQTCRQFWLKAIINGTSKDGSVMNLESTSHTTFFHFFFLLLGLIYLRRIDHLPSGNWLRNVKDKYDGKNYLNSFWGVKYT